MTISATPGPWATRFADLPLLGGNSELPPMDGDIALLHELRDRIIDAIADHPGCPFTAIDYHEIATGSVEHAAETHAGVAGHGWWIWPQRLDRGLIQAWKETP